MVVPPTVVGKSSRAPLLRLREGGLVSVNVIRAKGLPEPSSRVSALPNHHRKRLKDACIDLIFSRPFRHAVPDLLQLRRQEGRDDLREGVAGAAGIAQRSLQGRVKEPRQGLRL